MRLGFSPQAAARPPFYPLGNVLKEADMFPRKISTMALAVLALATASSAQVTAVSQLAREAGVDTRTIAQFPRQGDWRRPEAPRRGNEAGREKAIRSCMKASFDSDKQSCAKAANAAEFFDPAAAEACGTMSFGSNIAPCLQAIADKTYIPGEIDLCRGNSFDSGKIDCFRGAGRRYAERPRYERRPDMYSYILRQLRQVRSDIERGNILGAISGLSELISFIEEGSR